MAHNLVQQLWWCQEHIRWRHVLWRTVFFSDESHFMLFRADRCSIIYPCDNEHYAANCVLEHDNFSGGSVKVRPGIHYDGCTALVRVNGTLNTQIYWDEILQHHAVPLINITGGIVQHDNARPHTARVCRVILLQNNAHVL